MTSYNTNEFRTGLKIIFDGEPCIIIDNEFVKPGKGQAFNRVRFRKLFSGKILEKTFKSSDSLEVADVIDIKLTYLYNDGEFWYFMNNENFEQLTVDTKIIGENAKWLVEQAECVLTLWNSQPILIIPPKFVELKIIKIDSFMKNDSINTSGKLAMLTTGAIVKVPIFLQVGEVIKVDTRSGEYISRIK
ncbi:Elongation factor P [Candidatus Gullanella endobia]|uniref:Elongation factor P n=1 Tax=Candidatus Gullanella endobia TaxID=1070130 RepID=A0A143WRB3_9ENTR|nr:elongation factor P [Candidatus Gullanella endobia]CUX96141.1 Elongation factor P [Candidatus Gullanella endobia]